MDPKETNVALKFTAKLVDNTKGNYFTNIPEDLSKFLHAREGTMSSIIDNLYPNQLFEIEISIKSVSNG